MAIQPVGSVRSKYDLTRSRFQFRDEYELVSGTNLTEEGQWMIAGGSSSQQVTTSAGSANEVPMGAALMGKILGATFTNYEEGTVPASPGPYTYTLEYSNLVTNSYTSLADAYIYDTTAGSEVGVAGSVSSGNATVNVSTGVVTFHSDEAGHEFYIRYRFNLTVAQARAILKQSAVGAGSEDTFSKVFVGRGHCVIYTTMFDCDAAWVLNQQTFAAASGNPVLGAGGVLTIYDNNNAGTRFGRVVSLPSTDDPYLGVEYETP